MDVPYDVSFRCKGVGRLESWYSEVGASLMAQLVKNLPANAGDPRHVVLIPGLGRSPEFGDGNLLQYSCLENSEDLGAWRAIVHEVIKRRI